MGSVYLWGVRIENVRGGRLSRTYLLPITNLSLRRTTKQLTAAITRSSHVAGRSNTAKTFNSVGWSCFVVVDARRAISLEGAILWGAKGAEIVLNPPKYAKSSPELPIT